tara:strand:- start:79 stop:741 length:663 start_codon:yes stop_codon:yes gene_type:complete
MAIERKEGPFITKSSEFVYYYLDEEEKRVPVRKGQEYVKEISDAKSVSYKLSITKQRILKIKETDNIAVYKRSGKARKRDDYPIKSYPTSAKIGQNKFITRTFAQYKLDESNEIFEVVEKTNSNAYKFVTLTWQVGGSIEEAVLFNRRQLFAANNQLRGILGQLPYEQLHVSLFENLLSKRPEYQNMSEEQTQNENTQPAQPQSPTGPPPGVATGGAGGY